MSFVAHGSDPGLLPIPSVRTCQSGRAPDAYGPKAPIRGLFPYVRLPDRAFAVNSNSDKLPYRASS